MGSILVALLLLFGNWAGTDPARARAAKQPPEPALLLPGSVKVTSMPAFGWIGPAQCDSDGNVYWHSGYELNAVTFLKLLADGSHVIYDPTDEDAGKLLFIAYYVTSDGRLLVLVTNQREELYLLKGGDDAGGFTRSKIDAIEGVGPWTIKSFVALPDGTLLLQGYFDEKAPKEEQGHAYLIELDSSGRVVRKSSDKMRPEAFKSASESGTGAPVIGADGLIYFLESDKVVAVSRSGEVARRIPLHPPGEGYEAWQLNTSGGRLLITFLKSPGKKNGVRELARYSLLDLSTGEQLATYRPADELGNVLVCFSDEGLTFYRLNKDKYVELVTAPIK